MKTIIREVNHNGNIFKVVEIKQKKRNKDEYETNYALVINGETAYKHWSKIGVLLTMDDWIKNERY